MGHQWSVFMFSRSDVGYTARRPTYCVTQTHVVVPKVHTLAASDREHVAGGVETDGNNRRLKLHHVQASSRRHIPHSHLYKFDRTYFILNTQSNTLA